MTIFPRNCQIELSIRNTVTVTSDSEVHYDWLKVKVDGVDSKSGDALTVRVHL